MSDERPETKGDLDQKSQQRMSHDLVVQRLTSHCMALPKEDPVRLHFLCFFASICESYKNESQTLGFYHTVILELLQHTQTMLGYNESALKTSARTPYEAYRKVSRKGNHAPDALKHIALSQTNLLTLVQIAQL